MRELHSKIAVQKLDLPKGGGAIEGIGEKFESNGFTGTSALSLPIYASPCRDFAPSLSLSYSSGSGNGCFGMGWEPTFAKISRKTSKGLPHYDARDTFLYGGEDLVPIEGRSRRTTLNGIDYTIQQYYVRTESNFDLIEYWQVPETPENHSFWKITHANHLISIFGKREQAVICDPSSPNKIFEWLLEENYNPTGDHQLFFYKPENKQNIPSHAVYEEDRIVTANKYLQFVRYGYKDPVEASMILTDNHAIEDANKGDWHFEIVFDYGEYDIDGKNLTPYTPTRDWAYRPDPFSLYRATFEVRTMRRCLHTLCFHRFPDELGTTEPVLVKASAYSYESDTNTKLSHLTSIEEIGFYYDITNATYTKKALPPLDLEYQAFDPTGHTFTEIKQEGDRPQPGMEQAPYHFVDLYGEGISGILYMADNAAYYQEPILTPKNGSTDSPKLNSTDLAVPAATSTLSYSPPKRLSSFPLTPTIQSGELALRNITGDGQFDLVIASDAIKGFYETNGVEGWQNYQEFAAFPADYHQAYQEFGDLTGKGLADLMLLNGNEVRVYPSRKAEGFGNAILASHTATATLPPRLEKTEQEFTTLMDISGNGTPDIVRVRQNDITYWPSLGYGKFDKPITMGDCPNLGADFNTQRLFFADLDGSGSKDLLYFYLDHIKIYFNQSGNAWSPPIEIPFPTDILEFSDIDQISFADLFARGTTCLVISKNHAFPAPKHWYYDFGQQQKPYLLQKIINNLGAETEISYRSSVDYYLQDKKAGLPWLTCLPFPVQVVAEVTHHDRLSDTTLVQQHSYHHGYYDGEEQEFRGFGRVDTQDTETIPDFSTDSADKYKSPPAFSKTWYHTGAYEQEKDLGSEYKKEYWQGDKKAYPMPGTDFQMLSATPDPKTVRLSHVALFGTVIRHEVYGKDGTHWQKTPYSVSQTRMRVKELQAVGNNLYGAFFLHTLESISYDYDRNADDPHCSHKLVLEVDDYGAVTKSCAIAYGRREIPASVTIPNPDSATKGEDPNLYLYENVPQTAEQQQLIRFTYATQTYVDQTEPDECEGICSSKRDTGAIARIPICDRL